MNIESSDEMQARAQLYESAKELKRGLSAEDLDEHAWIIAAGIWQDAVLDYLQRTGRPDPS